MLERVRRQLDGVGQVVSCEDLVQLRACCFVAEAPAPAVSVRPPRVEARGLVKWGELVVDRAGHRVTWRGEELPLTPTERELLTLLIGPPLAVWSYERLCAPRWVARTPQRCNPPSDGFVAGCGASRADRRCTPCGASATGSTRHPGCDDH